MPRRKDFYGLQTIREDRLAKAARKLWQRLDPKLWRKENELLKIRGRFTDRVLSSIRSKDELGEK